MNLSVKDVSKPYHPDIPGRRDFSLEPGVGVPKYLPQDFGVDPNL